MLVISRKPHEKILIPAIKACIHVAAVQPGVVRVAISAPPEVVILRGEVADRAAEWGTPTPPTPLSRTVRSKRKQGSRSPGRRASSGTHLRERLRVASMTMGLARLQLRTSLNPQAEAVLHKAHRQIEALCRHLDRKEAPVTPGTFPRKNDHDHSMHAEFSPRLLQAIDA
jgi:sRNA-binding carbon storage regulator CsrA